MTWTLETTWQPTRLIEVAGSVDTSTGATEVMTDAGRAYIIRLKEMNDEIANAIVSTVPREWEVPPDVRVAWSKLIHGRAHYVADNVETWIEKAAPWFGAEREQE